MCSLVIWISSLDICPFRSFTYILIRLFVFSLLSYNRSLNRCFRVSFQFHLFSYIFFGVIFLVPCLGNIILSSYHNLVWINISSFQQYTKPLLNVALFPLLSYYDTNDVQVHVESSSTRLLLSAKLLQLCPTLCYPMDCSPPGSSVHGGILQARILDQVAMPSSRGSS